MAAAALTDDAMRAAPFRVFVGWDSREEPAFEVCRHSLLARASGPLEIVPLRQAALREAGLFRRAHDPLQSTEFTYTRFLVPHLAGYDGWALFCDCDFLWLADVYELAALADERYAAMCVHHDHRPAETRKMDDAVQTTYPRKNWSSMVLYNCAHPSTRRLTPEVVNSESGAYLHRFQWCADEEIGAVPETWNWLDGWSQAPAHGTPKVVHHTRGGPWFPNWQHVAYADEWRAEFAAHRREGGAAPWRVLEYWFEEIGPERWSRPAPGRQAAIADRFGATIRAVLAGEAADWRASPHTRLAEIVVLDRLLCEAGLGDAARLVDKARFLAKEALRNHDDRRLNPAERLALWRPLLNDPDTRERGRAELAIRLTVEGAAPRWRARLAPEYAALGIAAPESANA